MVKNDVNETDRGMFCPSLNIGSNKELTGCREVFAYLKRIAHGKPGDICPPERPICIPIDFGRAVINGADIQLAANPNGSGMRLVCITRLTD